MTTFIDKDTGAEYEQVIDPKIGDYSEEDTVVLRPVKEEPKWQIDSSYVEPYISINLNDITPNQLDAIQEAVEALMDEITGSHKDMNLNYYLNKARQAMKGQDG